MRSFQVIESKPVHEFHMEVFVGGKGMLEEEIIIDDSPKSLYFSICLWPTYSSVLVDNRKLCQHDLEAMEVS